MPELPEVETVRRSLDPFVVGRSVNRVILDTPSVWCGAGPDAIAGLTVTRSARRGKYLLFFLAPTHAAGTAYWLVVHLRMTGRLTLQDAPEPARKHTHVRIELDGETMPPIWLIFQDTRRFGRFSLYPAQSADQLPAALPRLGPEPLEPSFGAELLARQLSGHSRLNLKAALLNQAIVAGIGNIYADEILFASRLSPQRLAGSLDDAETARLADAVRSVLLRAVDLCGTTLKDYVDGWNRKGSFQHCLMVYGRSGQPCRRCGLAVQKKKLAGRSTHWCPACQPGLPD
jgi:formamidopyrimidine-DNA glycosylase